MTFDCRKPFATRDGRRPEVLSVGDDGCVEGVLDGVEFCWNADGRLHVGGDSQADLVNVNPTSPPDTEARSDASDDAAFVELDEIDANLSALLRYTAGFYGVAIEKGVPAGQAAQAVAHVEKAARRLHALARIGAHRNPAPESDGERDFIKACRTKSGWRVYDLRRDGIIGTLELPTGDRAEFRWHNDGSVRTYHARDEDLSLDARALPQPAGTEPVVWQWEQTRDDAHMWHPTTTRTRESAVRAAEAHLQDGARVRPLYAAPPAPAQPTSEMVEGDALGGSRSSTECQRLFSLMWNHVLTLPREKRRAWIEPMGVVRRGRFLTEAEKLARLEDALRDVPGENDEDAAAPPVSAQVASEVVDAARMVLDLWDIKEIIHKGAIAHYFLSALRAALARSPSAGATGSAVCKSPFDGHCCTPRDGEPFFVLLGRDRQAASLVAQWAADRARLKPGDDKIAGAEKIAAEMRAFNADSLAATGSAEDMRERAAQVADQRRLECRDRAEEYTPHSHYWLGRASEAALIAEISRSLPLTPPKPDATRAGEGR